MVDGVDTHVGADEDMVADGNGGFIEDREVEIAHEIVADRYLHAEIAMERAVEDAVPADASEKTADHGVAFLATARGQPVELETQFFGVAQCRADLGSDGVEPFSRTHSFKVVHDRNKRINVIHRSNRTLRAPESSADIVRHFGRNLHRILDQSAHPALPAPDGLVDQFAHALLLDRVDIAAAFVQQTPDDGPRTFVMTRNQRLALHLAVHFARTAVLVDHHAVGVAHRHGAVEFVGPNILHD